MNEANQKAFFDEITYRRNAAKAAAERYALDYVRENKPEDRAKSITKGLESEEYERLLNAYQKARANNLVADA